MSTYCRREGTKYRKALEWRIPVLNVQWLTDLMLGHLEGLKLPPLSKYQQFGSDDDFKVELWRVGHLLGEILRLWITNAEQCLLLV